MDSSSRPSSSRRRPRTPAITVDTSAINPDQGRPSLASSPSSSPSPSPSAGRGLLTSPAHACHHLNYGDSASVALLLAHCTPGGPGPSCSGHLVLPLPHLTSLVMPAPGSQASSPNFQNPLLSRAHSCREAKPLSNPRLLPAIISPTTYHPSPSPSHHTIIPSHGRGSVGVFANNGASQNKPHRQIRAPRPCRPRALRTRTHSLSRQGHRGHSHGTRPSPYPQRCGPNLHLAAKAQTL